MLGVISSSPGELEPVFQAMLENVTRICEAKFGTLYLYEADAFRMVATPTRRRRMSRRARDASSSDPHPDAPWGVSSSTKQTVQIADIRAEQAYAESGFADRRAAELGGARRVLTVPMLKEDELIGAIDI